MLYVIFKTKHKMNKWHLLGLIVDDIMAGGWHISECLFIGIPEEANCDGLLFVGGNTLWLI